MKLKLFAFWTGGWFTYWAIGTAAVGAIGSVVSSNNKKKAAEAAAAASGYDNVDLQKQQSDAISGNLANQSSIEDLLSRANTFQQGQASSLAELAMPGYSALSQSLTQRAQTMADHPYDLPVEVTKNLERLAAERGISTGVRGQANDFSLLRDFGVNSLQYGQSNIQGAQSITGLLAGIAPKVNPMSPLAFYVSPEQSAAAATNNNMQNQAVRASAANNLAQVQSQSSTDLWANLTKLAGVAGASFGDKKSGAGAQGSGELASPTVDTNWSFP